MFTPIQEDQLERYLKRAYDIYFGFTLKEFRKLVHDYFAVINKLRYPVYWHSTNKLAGRDWY